MTIDELQQKAKLLPSLPGIYMMRDSLGNIIYVGKSKALKKRVSSYFGKTIKDEKHKMKRMVASIVSFDYQETDTELDALLLECKLIKELKPIYNSLLKNDKRYRFIEINREAELPRVNVAFEKGDVGEYFGPYDIPYRLNIGVEAINSYYKLPLCKKRVQKKECLAYRMKRCIGPCQEEKAILIDYESRLQEAAHFLEGKDLEILTYYEEKMQMASERLEFEKAVQYREYIAVLKMLGYRKEAIGFSLDNRRGIALVKIPRGGFKLYLLRGTQIVYTRCFEEIAAPVQKEHKQILQKAILEAGDKYFKQRLQSKKHLEKGEVDEAMITYYYLKTKRESCYEVIEENDYGKVQKRQINQFLNKAFKNFQ
ncbi:GIY-YIG nuclease family protein [Cellulosilyticum sp. I15G10I2]|uniref:GIY-YIG nuclease family protein n=1 Tax=Cellulosilyticum sp. I15G10I2 TaxID=1892843 RepID=UPI00085CD632|nr:GIY-YIG nuclease family protein [Cellulosilyticum sp. I15G10I2]